MKTIAGVVAGVFVLGMPMLAQAPAPSSSAQIQKAAFQWQQDRDDHDRDRDRDRGRYGNGYGRYGQYHNVLAPEWQQKFDSYYQRWMQYRATNNTGEMQSMEGRMRDIMNHYNIPQNVPYAAVASPGVGGNNGYYGQGPYRGRGDNDADDQRGGYYGNGGYGNGGYGNGGYGNGGYYGNGNAGYGNGGYYGQGGYHNVLAPEWQQKFDSYYQRWLQYRATNNTGEVSSMEARMRDIMTHYNIPPNVPFDAVASPGIGGHRR